MSFYNSSSNGLQSKINTALSDPEKTRDDIAVIYAEAIESESVIDWDLTHSKILERWSKSALSYIKRQSRKLIIDKFLERSDNGKIK